MDMDIIPFRWGKKSIIYTYNFNQNQSSFNWNFIKTSVIIYIHYPNREEPTYEHWAFVWTLVIIEKII